MSTETGQRLDRRLHVLLVLEMSRIAFFTPTARTSAWRPARWPSFEPSAAARGGGETSARAFQKPRALSPTDRLLFHIFRSVAGSVAVVIRTRHGRDGPSPRGWSAVLDGVPRRMSGTVRCSRG